MKKERGNKKVVVLANGDFPTRGPALEQMEQAELRICCDGAAHKLLLAGFQPDVVVGDLDSLSPEFEAGFKGILVRDGDQDCNDLTKAVRYCHRQGITSLSILGATGLREDHTLGNISLMVEYAALADVRILSDYGEFFLAGSGEEIPSRPGEQFSIFSLDNRLKVTSRGLRYPLKELRLTHWYTASLNEATAHYFSLHYDSPDTLIIYRSFS